jgi:hypothetical protein
VLVAIAVGAVFVAWFVWCFAVWAREPHTLRNLFGGLGEFGFYLLEEINKDDDEPVVPRVRNLTAWHKIYGLVGLVALLAILIFAARYLRPIVARNWNR